MPRYTPFHQRLVPFNETEIWKNWSGYLVAPNYQYSISTEYYAIRNAVSILDTSPLFKYKFSGADAEKLLQKALVRDIRKCKTGQAQYTLFCDDDGFVVQDGVILRVTEDEFYLTAAEPALRYFRQIARSLDLKKIQIDDVSTEFGILAIQGPHSHNVLSQLTDATSSLNYFRLAQTTIEGCPVIISRTGYTGDLGYEIWIRAKNAETVWDAIAAAGKGYNLTPIGTTALKMARVEAGLLLMGVDFHSSRFAWSPEQKETPIELGFKWMLKDLKNDDRDFIGRDAIEAEFDGEYSRWTTTGLSIDVEDYEQLHTQAGILPCKNNIYRESTMSVYRRSEKEWDYAGYASSFLYSSLLKRPIAIAKIPLDLAVPGTQLDLEIPIIRKPKNVLATVSPMPFYSPPQKTAKVKTLSQGEKTNA